MTQTTFLSRITRLFGRKGDDQAPSMENQSSTNTQIERAEPKPEATIFPFWKRWSRRDTAIASLQEGFNTLTGLMTSIRDNLEAQSRRQDQLIGHLASLPALAEKLPETQRLHGETLKAIGQQLEQQTQQQQQLADILHRVSDAETGQTKALTTLTDGVQSLGQHNQTISANLRQVSSTMELMGRNSETSAQVLRQINEDLASRNTQMQSIIQRQTTRTTILLIVAMALSIAAIATVSILGVLMLRH